MEWILYSNVVGLNLSGKVSDQILLEGHKSIPGYNCLHFFFFQILARAFIKFFVCQYPCLLKSIRC